MSTAARLSSALPAEGLMGATHRTSRGGTEVGLRTSTVLLAFAAFGLLWGLYAAALPEIKENTGASDAELGSALVCVALAAAPAMFLTGRLLDRLGRPVVITAVALFAMASPLPTLVGSVSALVGTLLLFGLGSGSYDVVINSLAATVEAESGSRVMNRAHAMFSLGLLAGSATMGLGRASGLSASALLITAAVTTVLGVSAFRCRMPKRLGRSQTGGESGKRVVDRVVIGFGLLAALALLVESGVQQWSAVFLEEVVAAPVSLSSLGPGIFAGSMALGRIGGHWLSTRLADRRVLLLSGVFSGLGVLLLAGGRSPLLTLVGLIVTGAAISVAAPTIYGLAGRRAAASQRGATVGLTASVSYAGLLLGPVVVGLVASMTELRIGLGSLVLVSAGLSLAATRVPSAQPYARTYDEVPMSGADGSEAAEGNRAPA